MQLKGEAYIFESEEWKMKTEKQIFKELVKEYGIPIPVKDSETWRDVKAYGTCEVVRKDDSIWSFGGKLYRLRSRDLSLCVKKELAD